MGYGDILTRSFQIAWRRRYLWFLAVLSGEGIGGGSYFNTPGNFGGGGSGPNPAGGSGGVSAGPGSGPGASVATALADWLAAHIALIVAIGVLLAAVGIVLWLISTIAAGAVVRAAAEHDADRPYGLGPAWRAGVDRFWRVLGLRLIGLAFGVAIVLVFGLIFALGGISVANQSGGGLAAAIILGILLALLLVPALIVWSVLYILALRSIVLELNGAIAGLRAGAGLIRRRLGRVALTWLISIALGIAAGIALTIVTLVVAVPFLAVGAATIGTHSWTLLAVDVTLGVLVFLAASSVAGGAVGAFLSAFWTLSFRRFDLDPLPAAPAPLPAPT